MAFSVDSEEKIKEILTEVKKEYFDARHHCYAWILGLSNQKTRANDDGEPSHSAGDPILGQIKSFGLTNTLVVVVRYFGGTKLGVGGLVTAYKTATEDALKEAEKTELFEIERVRFEFNYNLLSAVERLITEIPLDVETRDYQNSCVVLAKIKKDLVPKLEASITDLFDLEMEILED